MDMDLKDLIEFVQTTARSVGAEISSPWFYLQFGLILAAAGIAYAAETAVRGRVDMPSLAMRWPLPLRHFARVMVSSASTAVFTVPVTVKPGRALTISACMLATRKSSSITSTVRSGVSTLPPSGCPLRS